MSFRTIRGYHPFPLLLGTSVFQRLKILGVGVILGAVFALFTAGPMMPSGMDMADRTKVWASVMAGPLVGTIWGLAEFHPSISLGWWGLLLIPVHPWRPNAATACVTLLGFSLWFFAGFLAMAVAVWGA